nr:D-alanyl-D-alanine carboxypeptidase [Halococcus agarilyticus]
MTSPDPSVDGTAADVADATGVAGAVDEVGDLVRGMNVPADNFVAAQLARTVASEVSEACGAGGTGEASWDGWRGVVDDHLAALGAGWDCLRDGSGLSRYDRLSARTLVAHLQWAADRSWGIGFPLAPVAWRRDTAIPARRRRRAGQDRHADRDVRALGRPRARGGERRAVLCPPVRARRGRRSRPSGSVRPRARRDETGIGDEVGVVSTV